MRFSWLLSCVSMLGACSNGHTSKSDAAGPLVTAAVPERKGFAAGDTAIDWIVDEAVTEARLDTTSVSADSTSVIRAWSERDQPSVVLRCEGGRIGAYIVPQASLEGQSGTSDSAPVRIALDSAPIC